MLIDVLQQMNEGRAEKGRGSKAGREKFSSKKGTKGGSVKARKSRVKVYDSIKAALDSAAPYGTIFSTKAADRLYVISKPTWGEKSRAGGNTRIAKGLTPGSATPSASWPSIKSHAVRTGLKHGKSKSKRLTAKYGPGKSRPEEKRFAGKKTAKKKPVKEAKCPAKGGKLAELLPLLNLIKRVLLKEAAPVVAAVGARAAAGTGGRAATGTAVTRSGTSLRRVKNPPAKFIDQPTARRAGGAASKPGVTDVLGALPELPGGPRKAGEPAPEKKPAGTAKEPVTTKAQGDIETARGQSARRQLALGPASSRSLKTTIKRLPARLMYRVRDKIVKALGDEPTKRDYTA